MLNINMEYKSGILFVRLIGSLNKLTANKLVDTLIPIIISQGIKNLVYNFDELVSIDEVGSKSLLLGYNAILNNNGRVLVVNNKFNLEFYKETNNELSALKILQI
ncbi:MAG: STAS domain-containing protein [Bacilli bacterium]|nr:STAS domain-containing protein [Bacilli bacterium]